MLLIYLYIKAFYCFDATGMYARHISTNIASNMLESLETERNHCSFEKLKVHLGWRLSTLPAPLKMPARLLTRKTLQEPISAVYEISSANDEADHLFRPQK